MMMNKKTQKAIAASKGRSVYYLTPEEAKVIDNMRLNGRDQRNRNQPNCKHPRCLAHAKDKYFGYCGNHHRMIERRGYDPATYDPNQE
jgi:hypothetical protein